MKFQSIKLLIPAVFFPSAGRGSCNRHAGFLKLTRAWLLPGLLAFGALALSADAQLPTNFNASIPVYRVIQPGATGQQATNLGSAFNIPPYALAQSAGLIAYLDSNNFLTFPTNYYYPTNMMILDLVNQTSNQYPAIPLNPESLNFSALSNLTVLSDSAALSSASNGLSSAGLSPQYGTPYVNHVMYTVVYSNANPNGVTILSNSAPLDTDVEYAFADPNGYPIIGPGEEVQFNFGSGGNITRLLYSACQLASGPATVKLMSGSQASNLVAGLFPPYAQISLQAVYYCPPYSPVPTCPACEPPAWHPTNIIPWYYCTATVNETNPVIGAGAMVTTVDLMPQLIPATFDTNYVPAPILTVQTQGTNVTASVSVTGGTPPYNYAWSVSDPAVSTNVGNTNSITYGPIIRIPAPWLTQTVNVNAVTFTWAYPSTGFILESTPSLANPAWSQVNNPVQTNTGVNSVTVAFSQAAGGKFYRLRLASQSVTVNETVTVTVTDANGVFLPAVQNIAAQAMPIVGAAPDPAIDYGCESPYDPGLGSTDRADWLTGMAGSGGGSERFCWTGSSAWPGDFIEPIKPGTLGAGPWVIGDADYLNYGVNTASIVLYIGHGNPNLFTFTIFGNEQNIETCGYVSPEAFLFEPYDEETESLALEMATSCASGFVEYNIPNYPDSWRNSGPTPNDNLYWLCLLSCEVLQEYDGSSPPVPAWTRWGPAFNGLHVLTGFHTNALAGTGFPKQYADNLLASSNTIVQAWLSAAHTKGTGTAAAMGPIGPGMVWDYDDHYWGKGSVGVSIPANEIQGWWYIKWPWAAPGTFP